MCSFSLATCDTGDVGRSFLWWFWAMWCCALTLCFFSSSSSPSINFTVQLIFRRQSHVDGCLSSAVSRKPRSSPSNSMLSADGTQQQAASHSEIQPHIAKICKSCCLFVCRTMFNWTALFGLCPTCGTVLVWFLNETSFSSGGVLPSYKLKFLLNLSLHSTNHQIRATFHYGQDPWQWNCGGPLNLTQLICRPYHGN